MFPHLDAAGRTLEASASRFGKGKGFALAGTGDAVETLSRDKTWQLPTNYVKLLLVLNKKTTPLTLKGTGGSFFITAWK